jgi:beta-ureidopropionase / N-carbamoyl-L-amino-acid hydrolase
MDKSKTDLFINSERMKDDFEVLAEFGATGEGGVHRPTFSPAHLKARDWFRDQAHAAGFEVKSDGAGNQSAILYCGPEPGSKTLLLGSHLDSVPNGGRFDGALGIVAAMESLRIVKENHIKLPFNLEVIDFTDEEGTLVGLLGSSALSGSLARETLHNPRGGREALQEGLNAAGITEDSILSARRDPHGLTGYLELHIEQGSRLLNARASIGVVTVVNGIGSYRFTFVGRADHAGTTTLTDRLDAAQGACSLALSVRRLALVGFPGSTVNVGNMIFSPGAFNIVPERVQTWVEYRSSNSKVLNQLEASLLERARAEARRFSLELEIESGGKHEPSPMSEAVQACIIEAAEKLSLKHLPLASGAGHDAQSLAGICPAGMIFVPSEGGASHSPREFTHWEDCQNGANVLLRTVLNMGDHDSHPS